MVASGFRARFVRGADSRILGLLRPPGHLSTTSLRPAGHHSTSQVIPLCYARAAPSDFDGPQCALSLSKRDQLLRRASRETANEMFKGATS